MTFPFFRRTVASPTLRLLAGALLLSVNLSTAANVLGTPPANSTISGVSVISGFHCFSQDIEVFIDGVSVGRAGAGTTLPSTAQVCGHARTGYSLLFNFNNLAPGRHTITVAADGAPLTDKRIPFATHTVYTEQSGGSAWREGIERSHTVSDFPAPGMQIALEWVESYQNFVITGGGSPAAAPTPLSLQPPAYLGRIGTPVDGSVVSGVSVISGYHCSARSIEVFIDGISLGKAGAGTRLLGTAPVCGRSDTGYSLLYNFNNLAEGDHVVSVHADGVVLDRHSFRSVKSGGVPWLTGMQRDVTLEDFPVMGSFATLDWVQSYQNFVVTNLRTCAAQQTYNASLRNCMWPMALDVPPLGFGASCHGSDPGCWERIRTLPEVQFITSPATEVGLSNRPIVFAYYEWNGNFGCFAVGICPPRLPFVHVVYADTGEIATAYPDAIQLPDGWSSSHRDPNRTPTFFARGTERGLLVKYNDLYQPEAPYCHEIRWVAAPTARWASFDVACPD